VEGDEARRLGRDPAKVRRQVVLDSLGRYFGPRAVQADDFLELDWQQEKWTGGCYGTLFGPNVWTATGTRAEVWRWVPGHRDYCRTAASYYSRVFQRAGAVLPLVTLVLVMARSRAL